MTDQYMIERLLLFIGGGVWALFIIVTILASLAFAYCGDERRWTRRVDLFEDAESFAVGGGLFCSIIFTVCWSLSEEEGWRVVLGVLASVSAACAFLGMASAVWHHMLEGRFWRTVWLHVLTVLMLIFLLVFAAIFDWAAEGYVNLEESRYVALRPPYIKVFFFLSILSLRRRARKASCFKRC